MSVKLQQGGISRDRRPDAVRDVICDVTTLHFNFLGPEWTQKLHSCSERYGGSQAVATRIPQKYFAPLPGRLEDPGLVARDLRGVHPARWLVLQLAPQKSRRLFCPWRKRAID